MANNQSERLVPGADRQSSRQMRTFIPGVTMHKHAALQGLELGTAARSASHGGPDNRTRTRRSGRFRRRASRICLPLITGLSEVDVPSCDGADAGNIIWMPTCGCGKYAVKLAEAFAGMHGRAVQVTTVPDDQQTHDLPVSDSSPAHPARTQSENVPLACGRAASWSPSPFAGLCSCSRQTHRFWGPAQPRAVPHAVGRSSSVRTAPVRE
jgi:hypothetical protein